MNFRFKARSFVSTTRNCVFKMSNFAGLHVPHPSSEAVSFQWKNPDFLLKNPDFLMKNSDSLLKNVDFIT